MHFLLLYYCINAFIFAIRLQYGIHWRGKDSFSINVVYIIYEHLG